MNRHRPHSRNRRRAFSLVEILIAVAILGVGLVMVATVFPVGANWTRLAVDDSLAQTVAQDAFATLQAHYPFNGSNANTLVTQCPQDGQLRLFTNLETNIPTVSASGLSERCYKFGAAQITDAQQGGFVSGTFPADPNSANYFWSALIRSVPSAGSTVKKYDVYILVFKRTSADQVYTRPANPATFIEPFGTSTSFPYLKITNHNVGTGYDAATGKISGEVPAIGDYGIGQTSGTVFRQYVNSNSAITNQRAAAKPDIARTPVEKIFIAPAADGANTSPLVYVFQTTLTF